MTGPSVSMVFASIPNASATVTSTVRRIKSCSISTGAPRSRVLSHRLRSRRVACNTCTKNHPSPARFNAAVTIRRCRFQSSPSAANTPLRPISSLILSNDRVRLNRSGRWSRISRTAVGSLTTTSALSATFTR